MDEEIEKIKAILLGFEWYDYGLGFVEAASTEWAEDLAERIANAG